MAVQDQLPALTKPPALSLREMKAYVDKQLGGMDPLMRAGRVQCLEICGQSTSFRDGFASRGMACLSFDVRSWIVVLGSFLRFV